MAISRRSLNQSAPVSAAKKKTAGRSRSRARSVSKSAKKKTTKKTTARSKSRARSKSKSKKSPSKPAVSKTRSTRARSQSKKKPEKSAEKKRSRSRSKTPLSSIKKPKSTRKSAKSNDDSYSYFEWMRSKIGKGNDSLSSSRLSHQYQSTPIRPLRLRSTTLAQSQSALRSRPIAKPLSDDDDDSTRGVTVTRRSRRGALNKYSNVFARYWRYLLLFAFVCAIALTFYTYPPAQKYLTDLRKKLQKVKRSA